jgi:hypothetical protein
VDLIEAIQARAEADWKGKVSEVTSRMRMKLIRVIRQELRHDILIDANGAIRSELESRILKENGEGVVVDKLWPAFVELSKDSGIEAANIGLDWIHSSTLPSSFRASFCRRSRKFWR